MTSNILNNRFFPQSLVDPKPFGLTLKEPMFNPGNVDGTTTSGATPTHAPQGSDTSADIDVDF